MLWLLATICTLTPRLTAAISASARASSLSENTAIRIVPPAGTLLTVLVTCTRMSLALDGLNGWLNLEPFAGT